MGLIHYIAVLVGFLFIFAGLLKLTPIELGNGFSQSEIKTMFKRYLSVLPVHHMFGVTITTTIYRSAVGFAETVFGCMLAFGRSFWRVIGAFYLLIIMIGAFLTHQKIGDPIAMASPPLFLGILLLIILLNRRQLNTNYGRTAKAKSD